LFSFSAMWNFPSRRRVMELAAHLSDHRERRLCCEFSEMPSMRSR
jgi:hypothetical protein